MLLLFGTKPWPHEVVEHPACRSCAVTLALDSAMSNNNPTVRTSHQCTRLCANRAVGAPRRRSYYARRPRAAQTAPPRLKLIRHLWEPLVRSAAGEHWPTCVFIAYQHSLMSAQRALNGDVLARRPQARSRVMNDDDAWSVRVREGLSEFGIAALGTSFTSRDSRRHQDCHCSASSSSLHSRAL